MLIFFLLTPCCSPSRSGLVFRCVAPFGSPCRSAPTPFRRLITVVTMAAPKKVGTTGSTTGAAMRAIRQRNDEHAHAAHRGAVRTPPAEPNAAPSLDSTLTSRYHHHHTTTRCMAISNGKRRASPPCSRTACATSSGSGGDRNTPRQRAAATRPLTNAAPRRRPAAADACGATAGQLVSRVIGVTCCATVQHQRLVAHCDCCHRAALVSALRSVRSLLFPLSPYCSDRALLPHLLRRMRFRRHYFVRCDARSDDSSGSGEVQCADQPQGVPRRHRRNPRHLLR